jgi:hypothetical protein
MKPDVGAPATAVVVAFVRASLDIQYLRFRPYVRRNTNDQAIAIQYAGRSSLSASKRSRGVVGGRIWVAAERNLSTDFMVSPRSVAVIATA